MSDYLFSTAEGESKLRKSRTPLPRYVGIPANANEINSELRKLRGIEE